MPVPTQATYVVDNDGVGESGETIDNFIQFVAIHNFTY